MKNFLHHLSWSILGVLISSFLLFIVNILIGRSLGPYEYGKYNLVITIANVFIVLTFLGTDTLLVKYVSETDSTEKHNSLLSNTLIILTFLGLLLSIGIYFANPWISKFLKTDTNLIIFSTIFAIIVALKLQLDNFTKALKKFRFQAKMRVIESIIILILTIITIFVIKPQTYISFVLIASSAALIISINYLWKFKKRIKKWDNNTFQQTSKYLTFALRSALIFVIVSNIDKFFVSGFMGTKELGLYSAYLMSFNVVVIQLIFSIGNVFFPTVNRIKDKSRIMTKIDHMCKKISIPIILVTSLFTYIIMLLFGTAYQINWLYIILVGIISFLQLINMFYGCIVASSHKLFKFTSKISCFKPFFLCALYSLVYFCHWLNIFAILLILIASFLFDIANTKLAFKITKS